MMMRFSNQDTAKGEEAKSEQEVVADTEMIGEEDNTREAQENPCTMTEIMLETWDQVVLVREDTEMIEIDTNQVLKVAKE